MNTRFHRPLWTIARFEFRENIRNKWLVLYGCAFLLLSGLVTYLGATDPVQAGASLFNLVALLVPLFALVFGSLAFSEAMPFQEMLTALPINRRDIFLGKWIGLGAGLSGSFLIGMGVGSLLQMNVRQHGFGTYALLLFLGVLLTWIFVGIAFCIATMVRKRERVFVWILGCWLGFFLVYDVCVIGAVLLFGDYPLDALMLTFVFCNPIDLARVMFVTSVDLSAMMGYSGALFQKYLGFGVGTVIGGTALLIWTLVPTWLGLRAFERRDL